MQIWYYLQEKQEEILGSESFITWLFGARGYKGMNLEGVRECEVWE